MFDNGIVSSNGFDRRAKLAEAGDLQGLMDDLAQSPSGSTDWKQVFKHMQRAIQVASEKEPWNFAEDVFRSMTRFACYASLRLQLACSSVMAQDDFAPKGSPTHLPTDLMTNLVPPMIQMQRHCAELFHAWASTMRQWSLVKKHRAMSDDPGKRRRRKSRSGNPPTKTKPRLFGESPN
jgi:hypothetical protein